MRDALRELAEHRRTDARQELSAARTEIADLREGKANLKIRIDQLQQENADLKQDNERMARMLADTSPAAAAPDTSPPEDQPF